MHILNNIKKNLVYKNQKIQIALKKIEQSDVKILFVLNEKDCLIGSITDGDIRRFLIKNKILSGTVYQFMNKKVLYRFINHSTKLNNVLMKKKDITYLPIVDKFKRIKKIQIKDGLFQERFNKVVLMAGGKGMRLRPLTKNTPKPLLKVNNIPLIESLIVKFINQGFNKFIISINYLGDKIQNYLGDGKRFGCEITYIKEKKYLGTAGSLSLIKNKKINLPIILMNSDVITNINFKSLVDYHKINSSDLTIVAKNYRNISLFGELGTKKNRVYSIVEKPIKDVFINSGIYVLNPELLKLIKKKELQMTDLINYLIKKKKKIFYYPIFENWVDVGNKRDLVKIINKNYLND
tara:strand:- start:530 stop:1579 length:1050 start_codon:yes stop_codon:yes gene_type:complete